MFQTVVWNMSCPGKPQVTLIGEGHVGSKEYFQNLNVLLGETTSHVWAGIEGLRETKNQSDLPWAVRRRLKLLRRSMQHNSELATCAGLIARGDGVTPKGRTAISLTEHQQVANWGARHAVFMRIMSWKTQRLLRRGRTGNPKAAEKCRSEVGKRYRGLIRFLSNPQWVERSIGKDTEWNNLAFAYVTKALADGLEVRLQMGAMHILALRPMLEAEGYTVSSTEWLNCADLTLPA